MSGFTMLLQFSAAMICILYLAWYFRVELVEAVPVFVCGLIVVLYVLAMLHHLSWIDGVATGILLAFALYLISRKKEEKREFIKACLKNMTQPSFLTAVLLLTAVVACTSDKVVTWWDDINFWAADVKALYFLDGFAGKYTNVAPEFGDYPPGGQLFKWWFLHLSPHEFREGLAFAGYYGMNLSFMFPLLKRMKGWNIPVMSGMAAALWFLPSIAEVYGYDGFCADLTMACIYGGFLYAVTDTGVKESGKGMERENGVGGRNSRGFFFYNIRLGLYLGVLVLIKSVGFVWALFGLAFLFLYERGENGPARERDRQRADETAREQDRRRADETAREQDRQRADETAREREQGKGWHAVSHAGLKSMIIAAGIPLLTGTSWLAFCLFMRRVTKTTATAVKYMTTDEYGISGYTGEFAGAFLKAFVGSPLHKERSMAIDLTPLGLYLCICIIMILFYRMDNRTGNGTDNKTDNRTDNKTRNKTHNKTGKVKRVKTTDMKPGLQERTYALLPPGQGRRILWFTVVSGALFYGVIFLAHITIFATETQYLEPAGMISSIERYGAPFTVGSLLFLGGVWLDRGGIFFQKENTPGLLHKYGVYLCFILFVALTAGYRVGYHGLIGYRSTVEEKQAERSDMIGKDEVQFLAAVDVLGKESGARVCYIRRGDVPRWVNNSYAAYEASPVSVIYRSVNLDDAPADWMVQEIRASHAGYLYAEETEADAGAVFDGITADGAFRCGVLYRIADDGANMELTEVSQ